MSVEEVKFVTSVIQLCRFCTVTGASREFLHIHYMELKITGNPFRFLPCADGNFRILFGAIDLSAQKEHFAYEIILLFSIKT